MGRYSDPLSMDFLINKRKLKANEASLCFRFRQMRDQLGLTQEQFAEDIGVGLSTIKQIEGGHNIPTARTIMAVHKKFRFSYNWIFTGQK